MFSASTAVAIEKECAADAITEIFAQTKTAFLPYVEVVVRALLPGLTHQWHDGIRKSSVAALLGFLTTFHEMSDVPKWTKGASVSRNHSQENRLTRTHNYFSLDTSITKSCPACISCYP